MAEFNRWAKCYKKRATFQFLYTRDITILFYIYTPKSLNKTKSFKNTKFINFISMFQNVFFGDWRD